VEAVDVVVLKSMLILPQWAAGHDEVVEVNQRDLIDKVLARYSGNFTGQLRLPRVP
jgi:hypothetical protein